jgi:hypothetical protein
MELLAVLAAILIIIAPILAISAFVRVQRLAQQLRGAWEYRDMFVSADLLQLR